MAAADSRCPPPDSHLSGAFTWPWLRPPSALLRRATGPCPVRSPTGWSSAGAPVTGKSSGQVPDVPHAPNSTPSFSFLIISKLFQPISTQTSKMENSCKLENQMRCLPWRMTRGSRIRENIEGCTVGSSRKLPLLLGRPLLPLGSWLSLGSLSLSQLKSECCV